MTDRRRWALRVRGCDEDDANAAGAVRIVVEAPESGGGAVWLAVDGCRIELHPADVSRLRRVLQLGQARALLDRGAW